MTVAGTLGDNPIQNTILFFVCQGTWVCVVLVRPQTWRAAPS